METITADRLLTLVLGFLLDGRTQEQREELLEMLDNPQKSREKDQAVAESYREDGLNELQIKMREEMRNARTSDERIKIRVKYSELAASKMREESSD